MSNFINTIDVLGDEAVIDSLINRSIEEYKDDLTITVGKNAFTGCNNLSIVDLPNVNSIAGDAWGGGAFEKCPALKCIVLRNTEYLCTLAHSNIFNNTPIKSGTGYIYVPRALVDSYKAATNWSTHANQIRALEDYTTDGTTTGDLDETKI